MKDIKNASILSLFLALSLVGCINKANYFNRMGLKSDGKINAECIFAKKINEEIKYTQERCILDIEKIRIATLYCVKKDKILREQFDEAIEKNKDSLNKDKIAQKLKNENDKLIDLEYRKLRNEAINENIEIIRKIDLENIDEDEARDYLLHYDNLLTDMTKIRSYSLKDIPSLLQECDKKLLKKTGPYHSSDDFVDLFY
jgi:hypothetical protein